MFSSVLISLKIHIVLDLPSTSRNLHVPISHKESSRRSIFPIQNSKSTLIIYGTMTIARDFFLHFSSSHSFPWTKEETNQPWSPPHRTPPNTHKHTQEEKDQPNVEIVGTVFTEAWCFVHVRALPSSLDYHANNLRLFGFFVVLMCCVLAHEHNTAGESLLQNESSSGLRWYIRHLTRVCGFVEPSWIIGRDTTNHQILNSRSRCWTSHAKRPCIGVPRHAKWSLQRWWQRDRWNVREWLGSSSHLYAQSAYHCRARCPCGGIRI